MIFNNASDKQVIGVERAPSWEHHEQRMEHLQDVVKSLKHLEEVRAVIYVHGVNAGTKLDHVQLAEADSYIEALQALLHQLGNQV